MAIIDNLAAMGYGLEPHSGGGEEHEEPASTEADLMAVLDSERRYLTRLFQ